MEDFKKALSQKEEEVSPSKAVKKTDRGPVQPGGVMPPQTSTGTQTQYPPQTIVDQGKSTASTASLAPKKRPSKIIFLIIGLVALLAIFVLLLFRLRAGDLSTPGGSGELVWWGLLDESAVLPLIEEYQTENKKVKITYIKQLMTDYRERLISSLVRGEGPDIFRIHNSWVPMFSKELSVLPPEVMSQVEFSQLFYPVIVEDLTTEQGIVGIPLGYDAITLYINQDIFASAGKTPPATWDEFRRLAIELTTKNDQGIIIQSGAALGRTENVDHWQDILALMMVQNGVNLVNPSGKLAEDAVKFFTTFSSRDNEVWSEILPDSTLAFANGKVAMYFGPARRAVEINTVNPSLRYKTIPVPQLRKDDPGEPDVAYATYWVEGVWKRSPDAKEAWDFLKFMSESESLEKLYRSINRIQVIGEPYPRPDMRSLLTEDKIAGSVVALAPQAKSWYLADETFDGETGINSQISIIFKEVISNVTSGGNLTKELDTAASEVSKVLSQFGVRTR